MTLSKKSVVFEKTREIVSKYELTGISKNNLIWELQHAQIASRMTVLEYLPEMADPKRGNIIELRVPKGKINPLCFPTPANQILQKLIDKFKSIKPLLSHMEKTSIGDCFIPIPNLKELDKNKELEPDTGYLHESVQYTELVYPEKNIYEEAEQVLTLDAHNARKELLEKLPMFLTTYINSPRLKLSNQIKKECIKITTPIILNAFDIFNKNYSESINISKKTKTILQKKMPKNSMVLIKLVKAPVLPYLEVEFLKILGRYYYSTSKKFSKNMQLDSCREQQIISKIITEFYYDPENKSKTVLDELDIKNIVKTNSNNSIMRDKGNILKKEYGFNPHSLALRLIKTFDGFEYNDDSIHIKKYYLKLFSKLHLFSKMEQQILDYVLEQEEMLIESKKKQKHMN